MSGRKVLFVSSDLVQFRIHTFLIFGNGHGGNGEIISCAKPLCGEKIHAIDRNMLWTVTVFEVLRFAHTFSAAVSYTVQP